MKKLLLVASFAVSGLLSAQTYPFNENFDAMTSGAAPTNGWTRGANSNFLVMSGHGHSLPNACSAEMKSSHAADTLITPPIGPITANTKVSISYRFVNAAGYPSTGATLASGDRVQVDAYVGTGWQNNIASFDNTTNPTPMTTWTTYTYDCTSCGLAVGFGLTTIKLRMDVARASGDWYLDIDDVLVADNIAGISYSALTPPALLVFPNPSNGNFSVWLKNYQSGANIEVSVYNLMGQKVKTVSETNAVNNRVNVSSTGLEKGIYMVEVKSGTEIAKTKINIE